MAKLKTKECRDDDCSNTFVVFNSIQKYCSPRCKLNNEEPKKINNRSDKRAKQEREYLNKSRPEYLEDHPTCEVCKMNESTEVHHKKGRIENLLNLKRWFLAVCRNCHDKIENNRNWARDNGYILIRINNE